MIQFYNRVLPDFDLARLKRLLQLDGELPEEVIKSYWRRKVIHDRVSGGIQMSADAIIAIVEASGVEIPLPEPPGLFSELQSGAHPKGTVIEVKWRNQWKLAEFVSATRKGARVTMDGEDRLLESDREMRIPETVEA